MRIISASYFDKNEKPLQTYHYYPEIEKFDDFVMGALLIALISFRNVLNFEEEMSITFPQNDKLFVCELAHNRRKILFALRSDKGLKGDLRFKKLKIALEKKKGEIFNYLPQDDTNPKEALSNSNNLQFLTEDILSTIFRNDFISTFPPLKSFKINSPIMKKRKRAILKLSELKISYAKELIIERYAKEKNPKVRIWIIKCLSQMGGNDIISFLKEYSITEELESIRYCAAIAMLDLGDNSFVKKFSLSQELIEYIQKEFFDDLVSTIINSRLEIWWRKWSGEILGGIFGAIVGCILGVLVGLII